MLTWFSKAMHQNMTGITYEATTVGALWSVTWASHPACPPQFTSLPKFVAVTSLVGGYKSISVVTQNIPCSAIIRVTSALSRASATAMPWNALQLDVHEGVSAMLPGVTEEGGTERAKRFRGDSIGFFLRVQLLKQWTEDRTHDDRQSRRGFSLITTLLGVQT